MCAYVWEETGFYNNRGMRLAALFYTSKAKSSDVLVICHGFTGSKEGGGKCLEMAEFFAAEAKVDVLLFDFQGNGQSEGSFADLTLSGQVDDLEAAVNWCLDRGAARIVTMGRSFGGSTVICHAARQPRVTAVCTWAAPADLYGLFSGIAVQDEQDPEMLVLQGEEGTARIKAAFLSDLAGHDVKADAERISPRPLLVVHGEKDEVVPPCNAKELYTVARQPKEIVYIPDADHRFKVNAQAVWEVSLGWLQRVLEAGDRSGP